MCALLLEWYLEMFSCRRSPESPWSPENGSGRVSLGRPRIERKSTKPPRMCFKAMKLWRCIRFQDSTHLGNLHIAASSTCHNAHGEIRYVWSSFVMWNWPKMPLIPLTWKRRRELVREHLGNHKKFKLPSSPRFLFGSTKPTSLYSCV